MMELRFTKFTYLRTVPLKIKPMNRHQHFNVVYGGRGRLFSAQDNHTFITNGNLVFVSATEGLLGSSERSTDRTLIL